MLGNRVGIANELWIVYCLTNSSLAVRLYDPCYLYESVDLVIGEVQSGEVGQPGEHDDLDDLELVVAEVQLHQAGPPVRAEGGVGQGLHLVVTERRRNRNVISWKLLVLNPPLRVVV